MSESTDFDICLFRQPILNVRLDVWGYAVDLCKSNDLEHGECTSALLDPDALQNGLQLAEHTAPTPTIKCVHLDQSLLENHERVEFPPDTLVALSEKATPNAAVLALCEAMQNRALLAVDIASNTERLQPFVRLADIAIVDLRQFSEEGLRRKAAQLHECNVTLLARNVDGYASLQQARELGFELFQGFFFTNSRTISHKDLSTSQVAKLQLLEQLGHPDNLEELTLTIKNDVSTSYRLLKYLNSPGMGLMNEVKSIPHAVKLLGEKKIKNWIRALLLSEVIRDDKPGELINLSVSRAAFLQYLSQQAKTPLPPESMYLLGLFSLLDVILDQPMSQVLKYLALDDSIRSTLLGDNTQDRQWLDLAIRLERGDWTAVQFHLASLGLTADEVTQAYTAALIHTHSFFSHS
ncbi:EAL and HDOD domain-containing protein [Desulfohalobium retbaense]|uniref:Diguanylate phosphodiesterase n=1 Tax=Desulfohalobium retbaense (strain ATCC 49708 / DSM 5692 / JCM 16813 / HR100) TaxID=485915 RepID=C8X1Y4_DESRD|nr:HDOD domain-containing protein [Desulfohalobium retbaense]ACV68556.1 diguanylate phosphodiesterase [Desulfohalobium retbaense DSM 5692]